MRGGCLKLPALGARASRGLDRSKSSLWYIELLTLSIRAYPGMMMSLGPLLTAACFCYSAPAGACTGCAAAASRCCACIWRRGGVSAPAAGPVAHSAPGQGRAAGAAPGPPSSHTLASRGRAGRGGRGARAGRCDRSGSRCGWCSSHRSCCRGRGSTVHARRACRCRFAAAALCTWESVCHQCSCCSTAHRQQCRGKGTWRP